MGDNKSIIYVPYLMDGIWSPSLMRTSNLTLFTQFSTATSRLSLPQTRMISHDTILLVDNLLRLQLPSLALQILHFVLQVF